jgi:hypothetical protein
MWGGKKSEGVGGGGLRSGQAAGFYKTGWIGNGIGEGRGGCKNRGRSASQTRHIVERCRRRTNLPTTEPSPYKRDRKRKAREREKKKETPKEKRRRDPQRDPHFARQR